MTALAHRHADRTFLGAVKDIALGQASIVDVHKAVIGAAGTTDGTWAGSIATLPGYREFYALLERRAVLLAAPFMRVPFSTPVAVQTTRPVGYKVAQGEPKPVTSMGSVTVNLAPEVVGSLLVMSDELLRSTAPGTDAEIAKQVSSAIISAANTALLDPSATGSITNGITPESSGGITDDALLNDLTELLRVGDAPVVVTSLPWAVRITAALRGAERLFPLLVAPEAGDRLIAVDPRGVAVAIGDVDVTSAASAALQMQDDPTTGATNLVSMFQTDSTAIRAQIFANWERLRDDAVAVLELLPPSP